MKEIKLFLASSEELANERKEIADLVLNLNEIYSDKGNHPNAAGFSASFYRCTFAAKKRKCST